jgi:Protein of unknown function (DUF3237)
MIPTLTPLARFHVEVGPVAILDDGVPGRRYIPILGGTVTGSLAGHVLPGGGDWQIVRRDGSLDIDAHYILSIDDHGLVEVRSRGLRHAPPEVLAVLQRGEAVDLALYYFRTSLRFATAAPGLARLNRILAIAVGARGAGTVDLDVFELG